MNCLNCGMWLAPRRVQPHECPEPFPKDVAEIMARTFSAPGAPPVHPRFKARIVLGLKAEGEKP